MTMHERLGPVLLDLAKRSIRQGLKGGGQANIDLSQMPGELAEPGAVFVTLKRKGELRGCIGSPLAWRPLGQDVVENAYKAAFEDPRFAPLEEKEWAEIDLSVSILTPPQRMSFKDEADLLGQLRPDIDGLIIEDSGRRALFLPSVWEALPDPKSFLAHLKVKAGLSSNHWSKDFKAQRFEAIEVMDEGES
ncbi:MAG: AmmeMemoRadiSam system protein A [Alphaproteobacteria bacterium]|nr:AmmeMemoRadiSam system protein A [Alphaproteobacteria bacterium]